MYLVSTHFFPFSPCKSQDRPKLQRQKVHFSPDRETKEPVVKRVMNTILCYIFLSLRPKAPLTNDQPKPDIFPTVIKLISFPLHAASLNDVTGPFLQNDCHGKKETNAMQHAPKHTMILCFNNTI